MKLTTLAEVLAASTRLAPIRFATRVDAAMETGNGIWNVVDVRVTRTLCAARYEVPNWLTIRVRISKANHSASTMIIPGSASHIMGPVTSQPSESRLV